MIGHDSGQQNTTYLIMFSLFLKLLGFFVVLYSYAEFEPSKIQAVEQSLQQRFNITLHLPDLAAKSGKSQTTPWAIQNAGRSYIEIEKELKTQMDFLSTEIDSRRGILTLSVPADIVLDMESHPAKSPGFAASLIETLKRNQPEKAVYRMQIVAKGSERDLMMRSLGNFVQSIIANDYSPRYLTIGYDDYSETPTVDFVIQLGAP